MDRRLEGLVLTGNLAEDAVHFLSYHSMEGTAAHCLVVGKEAEGLAARFGADVRQAAVAGWLHDVSAVVPSARRLALAGKWGLEVLPEEATCPMILHQKLSAVMAQRFFGVDHVATLQAIRCHTTLRRDAALLDKIVFLADKISWDQPGEPPYLPDLVAALERSLDAAVCVYLGYLWERRGSLPILHPWLAAAYWQLCAEEGRCL